MQTAAIDVADLTVDLGGTEILHGVTFKVEPGDIFGFIGPNGAGKTTTIRTMLGLYQPSGGTVTVSGHAAGTNAARAATGFTLDQDGLFGDLTATENIAYFRALYGQPDDPDEVSKVLRQVGLEDRAGDPVRTFSRGMRQRVAIARAIAHHPDVVIMDEPTSGVDPVAQGQIHDLITSLVRDHGKTVLLSSHNLDEVQRLCNRIALIAQGRIVVSGELTKLAAEVGKRQVTVIAQSPIPAEAEAALRDVPEIGLESVQGTEVRLKPTVAVSQVVAILAQHGVEPIEWKSNDAKLEQIFADAVSAAEPSASSESPAKSSARARRKRR